MRFQLALNVRDLDEAVEYYSRLFDTPVNKRKPGYANFAVEHPPLKLVLIEDPEASERLNHVGFETFDNDEVEATIERLEPAGLAAHIEASSTPTRPAEPTMAPAESARDAQENERCRVLELKQTSG